MYKYKGIILIYWLDPKQTSEQTPPPPFIHQLNLYFSLHSSFISTIRICMYECIFSPPYICIFNYRNCNAITTTTTITINKIESVSIS